MIRARLCDPRAPRVVSRLPGERAQRCRPRVQSVVGRAHAATNHSCWKLVAWSRPAPQFSVEDGIAERLGIRSNDTLSFDIEARR